MLPFPGDAIAVDVAQMDPSCREPLTFELGQSRLDDSATCTKAGMPAARPE
jgi:hypothetical protein